MMNIEEIIDKKNSELSKKYKWNKQSWISISNIKESVKEPFDQEKVAQEMVDKYFDDENSKYYHMSKDEILKSWIDKANKSKRNGNFVDSLIELYFNNTNQDQIDQWKTQTLNESAEMEHKFIGIESCLSDFERSGFNFECREKKLILPYVYKGKTYVINGRLDAIFSIMERTIALVDWKNSEEIKSTNPWQNLLGPCDKLPDCDLSLFSIQLYFYKYILEKVYGIEFPIHSYIIQFPSAQKDFYYKVHKPSFDYDEKLIEKIIKYVIEKKESE